MRFVVDITLGNDAMQSHRQVAAVLRKIAMQVETFGIGNYEPTPLQRPIYDINGNRVGDYAYEEDAHV